MQEHRNSTVAMIGGTTVCWLDREPALNDMLADPITQLLMRRDGVQEAEVRRLVARLRQRVAPPDAAAAND